jgi:DNA polymerase (family 10)
MKEVENISPAGSLRRKRETIGDIDILVATENPQKVTEKFISMPDVIKVWGKGVTKASVRVKGNFDIDLRVVPKESWGAALQYFTGSKAHNIKVRQIAIDKGFKLNEYGVFRGKKSVASKTEEEVYGAIGLRYLEPELREDTGEIELLQEKKQLPKIIPYGSLKGDLQVQTNWTDGAHSIEEMAKEAKRLGLEYIAITDHTKSLAMTGGADEKKLLRQMKEIDRLNKSIGGITILKGAEVNILKDGSLDIENKVLAKLDVVGVSVHSFFKMSKEDMTERIVRAINNPHVDVLFHPTGRLIQRRKAYELDMERVIKEAVKTGTVLEINAFPDRSDLKDEHIRMGVEAGAKFVIDSDAHSKDHLKYLEFGIAQARRGWAEANDVVNTLSLNKFLKKLK